MDHTAANYPCPACGFMVFGEPPGSYEICPICKWEDDAVQLESPGYAGGANRESLATYQVTVALRLAPLAVSLLQGYRRDTSWRPVTPSESVSELPHPRFEIMDRLIYYWHRSRPAI